MKKLLIVTTAVAVTAEYDQYIRATGGGGGITVTCPSTTPRIGDTFIVQKADAAGGAITVAAGAGALIDGAASISLAGQFSVAEIACVAANVWSTVSRTPITTNTIANVIPDPGTGVAIPVTGSGSVALTIGAGAETNTLAIPTFQGQRMLIYAESVAGGTRAITASQTINAGGDTVMTFNTARDTIELVAEDIGGALRWQVLTNISVVLT